MNGDVSDIVRDLLKDLPTEEVVNPNVGSFPEAVLQDAALIQTKNGGFGVNMTFDDNGRKRFAKFYFAEPDSHPLVAKKALEWQRALGIVEPSSKRGFVVKGDSAEDRYALASSLVEAIKAAAVGQTIGYKSTERGDFEDHTPLRG